MSPGRWRQVQRKNRVDAFDRALYFPFRPPWLPFLLAFALLVLLATLVPRWEDLVLLSSGVAWLAVCGAATRFVDDDEEVGGWPARGLGGLVAFRESALLLLVSVVSSVPILTVSLIAAGELGPEETFSSLGSLLIFFLASYLALGLCLAIWLAGVSLITRGGAVASSLIRVDKHFLLWWKTKREGFKYWRVSLFFLIVAGSMGELAVYDRWPRLGTAEPAILAFGFGYWSLLSIRLASALAEEFEGVLDSLYGSSVPGSA